MLRVNVCGRSWSRNCLSFEPDINLPLTATRKARLCKNGATILSGSITYSLPFWASSTAESSCSLCDWDWLPTRCFTCVLDATNYRSRRRHPFRCHHSTLDRAIALHIQEYDKIFNFGCQVERYRLAAEGMKTWLGFLSVIEARASTDDLSASDWPHYCCRWDS